MKFFKRKLSVLHALLIAIAISLFVIGLVSFKSVFVANNPNTQLNDIIYSNDFAINFTPQELHWLERNKHIRLGIDRAFPPFGSITNNHEYVGFSADIMRMIEYRLGITFDIAKDAPWDKTMDMARSGELDMISALVNSQERQQFLNFTPSYISNPTIIINDGIANGYIGSLKNLKGKTVAIERGSYSAGVLSREYPEIKLYEVENTGMALSLVAIGKADAYVGNGVTASYLIRKLGFHNLSYSGQTEYTSGHSIGIVKPNKMLTQVVNKALSSISRHDIETIANYWFGINTHSLISMNKVMTMGGSLLSLLIFITVWSFSLRKTKNKLKESQKSIKLLSEKDHLTGMGNRLKFYQYLHRQIAYSEKNNATFTLFFLDLDHFKDVNDSYGHAIGDQLLVEAAQRITQCVSNVNGFVARIGGDEFMIILPRTSEKRTVEKAANCIQQALQKSYRIEGNDINITTSIGITYYPDDACNADELVVNSDQAMYSAKQKGRNCYTFFNHLMRHEAQYKANLIRDLRQAVVSQQFSMHYQPIVELASNTISKAEALIRWQHPHRGLVSPVEFIPLAEEAGLINEIGEWSFREAIDHTVCIHDHINGDFQITINTSPLQYRKGGMNVAQWCNYLNSCGLTGDNVVVEITEGVLMESSQSVINNLFQLRDLKINVAIDDFGTGYSSLAYLKKFNIDYLKIDKTFVKNLSPDSDDLVLVQAIIVMAHRLGIKVIAEGIETQSQKDLLMDAGCDFGQGYYFSKPLNAHDFIELLKNWSQLSNPKSKQKQLPLRKF